MQEEKGGMELQSSVHAEVKAVATELRCINQGSLCCSTAPRCTHRTALTWSMDRTKLSFL